MSKKPTVEQARAAYKRRMRFVAAAVIGGWLAVTGLSMAALVAMYYARLGAA